jgi:hypothetical protein
MILPLVVVILHWMILNQRKDNIGI